MKEVKVLKNILDANTQTAQKNHQLLDEKGILAIDMMASPGAGKTSLIMKTISELGKEIRIGVIEGDLASSVDADKISKTGTPVIQINTGGGCHLDAAMVANALDNMDLDEIDLLFIENVGNLVCPAAFKLGEHKRLVLASVPEGDDKPQKYPTMFADADAIVITKNDLLPYLDFKPYFFRKTVSGLNPKASVMELSAMTGEGFDEWLNWLRQEFKNLKA